MKFKLIVTLFFSALCLNTINSLASAHSNDSTQSYIVVGSDPSVMGQPGSRTRVVGGGPELTRNYIVVGSDEGVMGPRTTQHQLGRAVVLGSNPRSNEGESFIFIGSAELQNEQKFQPLFSQMMGGKTSLKERKEIIEKTVDAWIKDGIKFSDIQEFAHKALERMKKVAAVYRANGRDDNDGVKAVEYFIEYLKNKIAKP